MQPARAEKRLENEFGATFQAGQHRGCRIEQRAMSEIAMRMRHDHRPRRLDGREHPHQTATFRQLAEQPLRRNFGGTVEDDDVIRRRGRLAIGAGCVANGNVGEPELG